MATTPAFAGSIPEIYHRLLGPLLFHDYARDLAQRLSRLDLNQGAHILELACGTGIATSALVSMLPRGSRLTATDISEPMLSLARTLTPPDPRLAWQAADGCALPFPDESADAIVCQYGVMFFPDKVRAMQEARRVLKPGGAYIFNVWGTLEQNPIPHTIQQELARIYPQNPPVFLNTPYGWNNRAEIERTTRAGGFAKVEITELSFPSEAPDAASAAGAYLNGTPLAADLADRKADMGAIQSRVADALAARFGNAPCRSTMSALVIEAR
jgi:SAM-dependent methyltransferase